MNNRENEMINQIKNNNGWIISRKYSQILMDYIDNQKYQYIYPTIYGLLVNELKNKKIDNISNKKYIQCWNTMINTLKNNKKIECQKNAIRLLHQTNIQRSYRRDYI
tara:strand:+ start:11 stop:331 length:321 start_codon:yes stop_codon:yes gene_type:complete